jgi:phosphatidylinositol glycan class V
LERNSFFFHLIKIFCRYDAFFFLKHSLNAYNFEKNYAFFPFFPYLLKNLSKLVDPTSPIIILGISLTYNYIMGIASIVLFYKLSLKVLQDENWSFKAAIIFTLNPSIIFYLAPYTATTFSFLTFFGFFILFDNKKGKLPGYF